MQHQRYNPASRNLDDDSVDQLVSDQFDYKPSHSRPSRAKVRWWIGIGLGVAIIVIPCFTAAFSRSFRHQIYISIVRQGTPYTQLYFASPVKLPTQLKVGKKNIFDFTIRNNENRTYRYTYTITLEDSRSRTVVSSDTVTVSDDDNATREVAVTPKDRNSKYLITVALDGMNQSIHFYANTS